MSGGVLLIVVIIFYDGGGPTSPTWPNSCHYPTDNIYALIGPLAEMFLPGQVFLSEQNEHKREENKNPLSATKKTAVNK